MKFVNPNFVIPKSDQFFFQAKSEEVRLIFVHLIFICFELLEAVIYQMVLALLQGHFAFVNVLRNKLNY